MKKKIAILLSAITFLTCVPENIYIKASQICYAEANGIIFEDKAPKLNEHNSYIADLGGIYEVKSFAVTQDKNGLDSYDIYLSSDGKNYALLDECDNDDKAAEDENVLKYTLERKIYAGYVKFVMKKNKNKDSMAVKKIEIFGEDGIKEKRIDGDADYSYYTAQPYQTGTDIRLQDREQKKLTDGDKETTITTHEQWANVVIDLKKPYQIGNVDIYSLASEYSFMEGCEIRYSLDGSKFFTYTYYLNKNEKNGKVSKSSFSGMPGRNARYLKLIMQSSKKNMNISEIEVNGYPIEDEKSESLEPVPLRVEMKNYLLSYLDWSTYNSENVSKLNLYIEKIPFSDTRQLAPKATYESFDETFKFKYATYYGLEPESTYYFAITPTDSDGNELTSVKTVKVKTPKVLGGKISDTFNMVNHPNYGGGGTVHLGSAHEERRKEAVRLMDDMGASNKNRAWELSGNDMYTKVGISTMMITMNNFERSMELGNYLFSNGNESDFAQTDVNSFFNSMKSYYATLKARDKRAVLCDPVLGGTIDTSLNWFDNLYKAGNGVETKLNFDVVDVHLYPKAGDEQIDGIPVSAPEIVTKKVEKVRKVMEKYGDGDKPIISTESGFQTSNVPGYQVVCDYETQRDYLVRMYIMLISEGVKEVWWYNYHDDGLDLNNYENNWGLIDFFEVPKPSYYGYYNMYQQLRNTEYVGSVQGMTLPYYGFDFYDETKNKDISVVWAADNQTKILQFETLSGEDEEIEIIGSDGSFSVVNTKNQTATTTIGKAPVYIYSKSGIKADSVDSAFTVSSVSEDTIRGKNVTFKLTRQKLGEGKSGTISAVGLPQGWSIVSDTSFDSTQKDKAIEIHVPETTDEKVYNFTLNMILDGGMVTPINLTVNVKQSVEAHIVPEVVKFGEWDKWKLAVSCTNIVDVPVSGKLSVAGMEGIEIDSSEVKEFDNIRPGETRKLYFDITKLPDSVGAKCSFILEVAGKRKTIDRKINFSACVNDGITPVTDGIISPGEWDNCQVITNDSTTFSTWQGESDLGFKVYRKWDNDNFYMAVDVTDDVQYQPYTGSTVWQADSIQFAIDPERKDGVGNKSIDYFEIGLSGNDKNELQTWAWYADLSIKKERPVGYKSGAFRRTDDGHTIYEIAIPWSYFKENGTVAENDCIGFSIAVNDNDGTGRKGWLMYMRGITDNKDANSFEDMVLVKK